MGVNSLPKTVTRQRRDCGLNPGPSAPESSTLPMLGYRATMTAAYAFDLRARTLVTPLQSVRGGESGFELPGRRL